MNRVLHGFPPKITILILNRMAGLHVEFVEARASSPVSSIKRKVHSWCPPVAGAVKVMVASHKSTNELEPGWCSGMMLASLWQPCHSLFLLCMIF